MFTSEDIGKRANDLTHEPMCEEDGGGEERVLYYL